MWTLCAAADTDSIAYPKGTSHFAQAVRRVPGCMQKGKDMSQLLSDGAGSVGYVSAAVPSWAGVDSGLVSSYTVMQSSGTPSLQIGGVDMRDMGPLPLYTEQAISSPVASSLGKIPQPPVCRTETMSGITKWAQMH